MPGNLFSLSKNQPLLPGILMKFEKETAMEIRPLSSAYLTSWGVGTTVDRESALRFAETFLLRVRALPLRDGGPENLRSPYYRLAVCKN
ncbi:hypothetical protein PoB_002096800 [Plakobranchus ocellatus]|uniref:Uncharacterized protein n=1 Tax=Plakobranchus ocellatus TaxID=259542 RepID=A0AAV3ZIZ3_9GAST|nr:hypothetical protein PoB_002096800 [Plakobranchus ocellatus]